MRLENTWQVSLELDVFFPENKCIVALILNDNVRVTYLQVLRDG